jgi:hypothetical protein
MLVDHKATTVERRGHAPLDGFSKLEACEVLVKGRWTRIPIEAAQGLPPRRLKRCCECLGGLELKAERFGDAMRFVHRHPHPGCSRDDSFTGRRTRHPKALT